MKTDVAIAKMPKGRLSLKEAHARFAKENPEYAVKAVRQEEVEGKEVWAAILEKIAEPMPDELNDVLPMDETLDEDMPEDEEETDDVAKLQDAIAMLQEVVDSLGGDSEEDDDDFAPEDEFEDEFPPPVDDSPVFSHRKKERGLTLAKARKEARELSKTPEYKGLRLASVEERPNSFVAKFVKATPQRAKRTR